MSFRLKYIRLAFGLAIFIVFLLAFTGIPAIIPGRKAIEAVSCIQFVPSLLKFLTFFSVVAAGFILVLLLTLLFGRIYCSALCPLGIFQDFISRLGLFLRKKKIYRYSKPFNWLRFGILAIVILSVFTGSILLLNLLDPYSNFGKIFSVIFRPVALFFNDSASKLLEKVEIYSIPPVGLKGYYFQALVFPFIFLVVVTIMAAFRGRLFCNTICPVGSLLGLVSKVAFFKISIDEAACTRCGKCSTKCKAGCIDIKSKQVDFSRCVGCFNCLRVCPEKGIHFQRSAFVRKSPDNQIDVWHEFAADPILNGRRDFLGKSIVVLVGLSLLSWRSKNIDAEHVKSGKNKFQKTYPVSPPGSYSLSHFTSRCTACQLCVSTCPTQVLQPSVNEYGISGMMQPRMDFSKSFCNYDCTKCSEVCPNGALIPVNSFEKKAIQVGKVTFIKNNCVVFADETACGACSEHCPTKAVHMVPYKNSLTIPETDVNICVGCGACEYACPAKPYKAIYVEGNPVHRTAFKPKEETQKGGVPQDFPF
jgi:ferredoxin